MDPSNLLTIQNFATVPMGIAIVWAVMGLIANIWPALSSPQKTGIQALVAFVWATISVLLFLTGDWVGRLQQGLVAFVMVAGTQYWGYQLKSKLLDEPAQARAAYTEYPEQGVPEGRI